MDWTALALSLELAACTMIVLLPIGMGLGRLLASRNFRGKALVEAGLALPLVLPPTVLGYYLLVGFGGGSSLGQLYEAIIGRSLVFTFEGLLLASVIFNLPFAVQPMQRAFAAIPGEIREAAACCGMSFWQILWWIDLPLAWPGILAGLVLIFAHTIGEFGVVLMVGGSIPGETKTIAIAIYDRVQAFDSGGAGLMSGLLLLMSMGAIAVAYTATASAGRRPHG